MSGAGKAEIARRPLLVGLLGAAGVVAVAIAAFEGPRLLAPRHPASPFDDLLAALPDRDNAILVGTAFLKSSGPFDAQQAAGGLRQRLRSGALTTVLESDLAAGRLEEAQGWVLPETLLSLCALAARAG